MIKHRERLVGVSKSLAAAVDFAADKLPFDVLVVEGVRTVARQRELYAQGRTAPGKVVTWTMMSQHIGGRAVDLAPLLADGSVDWSDPKKFDAINTAMQDAAKVVGVRIRWGADWDVDGKPRERGETDSPHFELA